MDFPSHSSSQWLTLSLERISQCCAEWFSIVMQVNFCTSEKYLFLLALLLVLLFFPSLLCSTQLYLSNDFRKRVKVRTLHLPQPPCTATPTREYWLFIKAEIADSKLIKNDVLLFRKDVPFERGQEAIFAHEQHKCIRFNFSEQECIIYLYLHHVNMDFYFF